MYSTGMETTSTPASTWLRAMSERLQQQWPTIDPQRLDDLALDLWRDERLRALPARDAAEVWLQPVTARD
jgi:hypothetical protein